MSVDNHSTDSRENAENAGVGLSVAFVDEDNKVVSSTPAFNQALSVQEGFSTTLPSHLCSVFPHYSEQVHALFAKQGEARLTLETAGRSALRLSITRAESGQRIVQLNDQLTNSSGDSKSIEIDPLTKLGNRRMLDRELDRRARADTPIAMIMMDLDRFKQINDTLGHGIGDKLLELVAKRTKRTTREQDTVVRLGGDEFIVLHETGDATVQSAQKIASRLVEIMSRPFLVDGHQLNIGASVGISVLHEGTSSVDDLMRHADLALYAAKEAGRNNYQMFVASLEEKAMARRRLEIQLRRALSLKQFELVYQPQVDMPAGALTGFEALIRWNSSDRGMIPPDQFIPLAEETGEIIAIGEWVLETACKEAARWENDLIVAVNVSPIQFTTDQFVDSVTRALHNSGLPPHRLEIEITESVLINKPDQALEHLLAIRDMGVSIAMDDFGTGYSSLSYLNNFPFSKIKIDRAFVGSNTDGKSRALVNAIITLGASLGMKTLAEGVETAEQFEHLSEAGCIAAQGYLISRPLQTVDIDNFLQQHNDKQNKTGTTS